MPTNGPGPKPKPLPFRRDLLGAMEKYWEDMRALGRTLGQGPGQREMWQALGDVQAGRPMQPMSPRSGVTDALQGLRGLGYTFAPGAMALPLAVGYLNRRGAGEAAPLTGAYERGSFSDEFARKNPYLDFAGNLGLGLAGGITSQVAKQGLRAGATRVANAAADRQVMAAAAQRAAARAAEIERGTVTGMLTPEAEQLLNRAQEVGQVNWNSRLPIVQEARRRAGMSGRQFATSQDLEEVIDRELANPHSVVPVPEAQRQGGTVLAENRLAPPARRLAMAARPGMALVPETLLPSAPPVRDADGLLHLAQRIEHAHRTRTPVPELEEMGWRAQDRVAQVFRTLAGRLRRGQSFEQAIAPFDDVTRANVLRAAGGGELRPTGMAGRAANAGRGEGWAARVEGEAVAAEPGTPVQDLNDLDLQYLARAARRGPRPSSGKALEEEIARRRGLRPGGALPAVLPHLAGGGLGAAAGYAQPASSTSERVQNATVYGLTGLALPALVTKAIAGAARPGYFRLPGENEPNLRDTRVLDEQGNPKVVYHGTGTPYENFDPNKVQRDGLYGPGYYFTDEPRIAGGTGEPAVDPFGGGPIRDGRPVLGYTEKGYSPLRYRFEEELAQLERERQIDSLRRVAGMETPGAVERAKRIAQLQNILANSEHLAPNVRPARLALRNPFDIDRMYTGAEVNALLDRIHKRMPGFNPGSGGFPENVRIHGRQVYDRLWDGFEGHSEGPAKELANKALLAEGYDGITHIGGGNTGNRPHQVYIAFDRAQIRSPWGPPETARQWGGAAPQLLAHMAGGGMGAAAGFAQPADSPLERAKNTAVYGLTGLALPQLVQRAIAGIAQPGFVRIPGTGLPADAIDAERQLGARAAAGPERQLPVQTEEPVAGPAAATAGRQLPMTAEELAGKTITESRATPVPTEKARAQALKGAAMVESLNLRPVGAKRFRAAFVAAQNTPKGGRTIAATTSPKSVEEYAAMKTFLSPDGRTGYAVAPDGEVVSLFNSGESGAGSAAALHAQQHGGKYGDAYDTFLMPLYHELGGAVPARTEAAWEPGREPVTFFRFTDPDPKTAASRIGQRGPYERPTPEVGPDNPRISRAVTPGELGPVNAEARRQALPSAPFINTGPPRSIQQVPLLKPLGVFDQSLGDTQGLRRDPELIRPRPGPQMEEPSPLVTLALNEPKLFRRLMREAERGVWTGGLEWFNPSGIEAFANGVDPDAFARWNAFSASGSTQAPVPKEITHASIMNFMWRHPELTKDQAIAIYQKMTGGLKPALSDAMVESGFRGYRQGGYVTPANPTGGSGHKTMSYGSGLMGGGGNLDPFAPGGSVALDAHERRTGLEELLLDQRIAKLALERGWLPKPGKADSDLFPFKNVRDYMAYSELYSEGARRMGLPTAKAFQASRWTGGQTTRTPTGTRATILEHQLLKNALQRGLDSSPQGLRKLFTEVLQGMNMLLY